MRDNVNAFVQLAAQTFAIPEPILEVGSRPAAGQEGYTEPRSSFRGRRYIGGDFLPGPNVLSFVPGLRSNVVYKAAPRAGRLFRRR